MFDFELPPAVDHLNNELVALVSNMSVSIAFCLRTTSKYLRDTVPELISSQIVIADDEPVMELLVCLGSIPSVVQRITSMKIKFLLEADYESGHVFASLCRFNMIRELAIHISVDKLSVLQDLRLPLLEKLHAWVEIPEDEDGMEAIMGDIEINLSDDRHLKHLVLRSSSSNKQHFNYTLKVDKNLEELWCDLSGILQVSYTSPFRSRKPIIFM